ncbi:MAG: caspase family protein [Marinagarivorans sp.]|nr:caspase family protein [Marinagarivorans sp.]
MKYWFLPAVSISVLSLLGCVKENSATSNIVHKDDLAIVDCLLPGQIRKLGTATYNSARRATKTTASDCNMRGGEYVAYDRASYESALAVWLPLAKTGDASAQNYVGEIYEKGLGIATDYSQALFWYSQAAEQDFARAQINLGLLYEQGLGADRNLYRALELYRMASGVDKDAVLLSQDALAALESEKNTAEVALQVATEQSQSLEKQLAASEKNYAQAKDGAHSKALRALYEHSLVDRSRLQDQLDSMALAYRSFSKNLLTGPAAIDMGEPVVVKDINFGRYYALIIGNQNYEYLDDLRSPIQDAKRLQAVLEQRYGFKTRFLENATEKDILLAINQLFGELTEHDNLVIFYAGHGEISSAGLSKTERGYWLPVDAQSDNISHWINNAVISDHLDRLRARSILVVSDSCFAGYLGADNSPYLFGLTESTQSRSSIERGIKRRARVVISSGGEKPVLDGNEAYHSIFAGALIEALEANQQPLRDSQLFALLSVNVGKRAETLGLYQKPEMKPVREAGHEGGSFYFVPTL